MSKNATNYISNPQINIILVKLEKFPLTFTKKIAYKIVSRISVLENIV